MISSFFIWFFTSNWTLLSTDHYNLSAPSSGSYRLEAQIDSTLSPSPLTQFTTSFTWSQQLSGSNNNRSECFLAFDSSDTIFLRVGETGPDDPIRISTHSGTTIPPIYASSLGLESFGSDFTLNLIAKKSPTSHLLELTLHLPLSDIYLPLCSPPLSSPNLGLTSLGITAKCTSSNTENFAFSINSITPYYTSPPPLTIISHTFNPDYTLDLTLNSRLNEPLNSSLTPHNTTTFLNTASIQLPPNSIRPGIPHPLNITISTLDTTLTLVLNPTKTANFRDLVFTELMADATPSLSPAIPEDEFIEVLNNSNSVININDWQLIDSDNPHTLIHLWDGILYPDSTFLIVKDPDLWLFHSGPLTKLSNWSGLNDNGESLQLVQQDGKVIDEIEYEKSWWLENDINTQPGRSLTKSHPRACNNSVNWTPSPVPTGSSPWIFNPTSPTTTNPVPPTITPHLTSPSSITLEFSPAIAPSSSPRVRPSPTSAWTPLSHSTSTWTAPLPLIPGKSLTLEVDSIMSCHNSTIIPSIQIPWHTNKPATPGDIVISEICHSPIDGGEEWIELVNISGEPIDSYGLQINNTLLFNETFKTIEINEILTTSNSWSPLSSTKDEVTLTNHGDTIDYVYYNRCWHTYSDSYESGASLERINLHGFSNSPSNWESGTGPWNSSPGTPRENRPPKPHLEGEPIWALEENRIIWTSPVSMDSCTLSPINWTPPISWRFIDPEHRSAISVEEITGWGDSLHCSNWKPLNSDTSYNKTMHIASTTPNSTLTLTEVLSDPNDGGTRFLELANFTDEFINLSDFFISTDDFPSSESWVRLSEYNYLLTPGDHIALGLCSSWIDSLQPSSRHLSLELPSLLDGRKIKLARENEEISYSFEIPKSSIGVSVERVCPDENIWVESPSPGVSPGMKNLSYCSEGKGENGLEVWPRTIKREREGSRWVNIQVKEDVVGVLNFFSTQGELVRSMDVSGEMRIIWEGDDENGFELMPGNYVIELNGERALVAILE